MLYLPEKKTRQKFYRSANLIFGIYGFAFGYKNNDKEMMISSIILFIVDAILLYKNIYDVKVLQITRILAFLVLGPLWISKGKKYNNKILMLFGLTFILFDGFLYFQDF